LDGRNSISVRGAGISTLTIMSGMTVGTCPSPKKRVQDALSFQNKLAETTTASNPNVNQRNLTSMLPKKHQPKYRNNFNLQWAFM